MKNQEFVANLIAELDIIPQEWQLIPVDGNKSPELWKGWRNGFDRDFIKKEIKSGRAKGFGLLTGTVSGGILAIDCDGEAAHKLAEKMGGIPHTVCWSSGLPGRAQYLVKVPEQYWGSIATKKIKTGVVGSNGKEILLELRWDGCQSVFRGVHPDTGLYKSINGLDTPIAESPVHFIEKMLVATPSNPDQLTLNFNNSITPIPLYDCLPDADKKLIDNGALNGSRNDSGAKLARNLLGTAQQLNYLGFRFDGNPEILFNQYCDKCNPSLPEKERRTIWKSALKSNPGATLTDDVLAAKYKKHQQQQRQIQPSNNGFQTSGTAALKTDTQPEAQSNIVNFPRQQPQLNIEDIDEEFSKIAEQNLPKSKLQLKLNELAKKCNHNPKEISECFKNYLSEIEQEDSKNDIKIEFEELLKNRNQTLNLAEYLPGNLTKIGEFANRLCLRPELGLSAFLTVCSSLLAVGTDIDLLVDYCQFDQKSLGMYTAICAEPSQKKSPLINKIALEPLLDLQEEARKQYEQEMADYQIELADWASDKNNPDPEPQKPIMRRFFISGGTQAGIRNVLNTHSKNGWGLLVLTDELAASYKNNGKTYNAGLLEDFLTYYDGYGKSEALNEGFKGDFSKCLVAMLGGIQPGVISEYMNGSDGNGHWSRVSVVSQPVNPFLIPDNLPGKLDFKPMLVDFYKKLSHLPQLHFTLDAKAKAGFIIINNKCEMYRVGAKTQALASLWGKMPGKIGRFAALLHIIEQVWQYGTVQSFVVGKTTLDRAVELAKFYYHESYSLYADCSQDKSDLAPQLVKVLGIAEKQQKAIGASDVKRFDRQLSKLSPDDIRAYFIQLVELGYGEIEGSGIRLKFKSTQIIDKNRQKIDKTVDAETVAVQGLQPIVDKIDKKNKNLENEPQTTQLADIPHIETEAENVNHGENLSILSTNPSNLYTVDDAASTNLSTERLFLSISGERSSEPQPEPIPPSKPLPDDYRPSLAELTSADPLPSLINLALLIDFDSLKQGETIFDTNGNQHTLRGQGWGYWLTTDGLRIDKDNINNFHRE